MDSRKEEFLARLRETFRVEAAEHLEALTAGLLAVERADDAGRASIVESIFREAHSLKGAARSVSLAGAEALCQELESIFAAMKRQELTLSAGMLDAIHPALRVLSGLCAGAGAPPSPEVQEGEAEALAALRQIVRGLVDRRAEPPDATLPSAPSGPSGPPGPCEPRATGVVPAAGPEDSIRVSTRKLDSILLGVEELVGARISGLGRAEEFRSLAADLIRWNQRSVRQATRRNGGRDSATAVSETSASEALHARTLEHSLRALVGAARQEALSLSAVTDRLLDETRNLLLLPCSYLLKMLPAVVRDLAREQGKEADLLVSGEDIEIDRRVLDGLKDPLIHLLRNCVDHGIESPGTRLELGKPARGAVSITVRPVEGNRVELTLADDGSGIDPGQIGKAALRLGLIAADEAVRLAGADLVNLVFRSGLSTSAIITDLSGRGLGLAIAREKVEKLGGTIAVASTPGAGTTFRMLVPLSLAAFRGVFVAVSGRPFVIPTASVVRLGRIRPDEVRTVENRQAITMDGSAVSLVRLRDVLELPGPGGPVDGTARPVVLVHDAGRQVALLVDEVRGEQEVMVRGLGRQLPRVRNIAGACISGGGVIVPILNVADLVESAVAAGTSATIEAASGGTPERRGRLLIAEDSITSRTLVKGILEGAGYEVVASVDGVDALTRLKTEPFDLLVSDVDMPRMNGFELTSRIRADRTLAGLPVVLVTALGSQKDREYGIEVGANAYIVKSDFDQGNLLEVIRRLL